MLKCERLCYFSGRIDEAAGSTTQEILHGMTQIIEKQTSDIKSLLQPDFSALNAKSDALLKRQEETGLCVEQMGDTVNQGKEYVSDLGNKMARLMEKISSLQPSQRKFLIASMQYLPVLV